MRLDAATVLLQWASGGLLFCWLTTRNSEIGRGYTWLLHGVFATMAAGAFACGLTLGVVPVREGASLVVALLALLTLRKTCFLRHSLVVLVLLLGRSMLRAALAIRCWHHFVL